MAARVTLCRALTVTRDGETLGGPALGTRKARLLLAVLASAGGAAVPLDRLTESLWPDGAPQDPAANLATLASRLRRTLGDRAVVPGPASYALGRQVGTDLDMARDLLTTATARLARREPTLALASAARAHDLVGDGRLADECAGAWAESSVREAAELAREARHLVAAAALASGQPDVAVLAATSATASDPYDERAHRDLIRALVADGRPAAALAVHTALTTCLADDLGSDPDAETQRLHLAVLRGTPLDEPDRPAPSRREGALVGRADELARVDRAWAEASAGRATLLLVSGTPGIGKTRLLDAAARVAAGTGGLVLATGCRPDERSVFLQPFVEVLRPVLLALPQHTLTTLLGGHLQAWARLLPELTEVFDVSPAPDVSPDLARRRSFDAVVAVVAGLAARTPVLLAVDDLQYGADLSADLVAHLAAHLGTSPVLLLVATRTDGLDGLPQLTRVAESLPLGPLPPSAVSAITDAAGFSAHAADVQARTLGHPLSVVAALQALAAGTVGVPESLAGAVTGQVAALPDELARLVGAASVLGSRVAPLDLSRLVDRPEVEVVLGCEDLVRAGLLSRTGATYHFVNDLVQEAVAAALPAALAVAYHRQCADLLADQPERMAGHAHAAGELDRAARGYLAAGRTARRSAALDDALHLLDLAYADAEAAADAPLCCAVLMERARVHEAAAAYDRAERDVLTARATSVEVGDPRLQMRSLALLGGDIATARGHPIADQVDINRQGRIRAAELGDAVAEARFASRIAVLEASRLRLDDARVVAEQGVRGARATGSADAVVRSLDGLKTVHAYCGDPVSLAQTVDELIPLLRDRRLTWLLQWAVAESALVPAAHGDWPAARRRIDDALEINRETGYGAYAGFFHAQRGWLARLAGDLDAALTDGRRSLSETSPDSHPWWYATARGLHAATLLDLGRPDEAAELCREGLAAVADTPGSAYTLRSVVLLAAATGDGLEEADRRVAEIQAAPGRAWIWGADVYDALAAAWTTAGEPERAAAVARPLLAATTVSWQVIHDRVVQRTSATSAAARSAPPAGTVT